MLDKDKYIKAYRILNENLPRATREMSCCYELFECKVKEIIRGDSESIVIVEMNGFYPAVTNEWSFIIE